MSIEKIFDNLQNCGVLAVLVIDNAKDAVPLAESLLAGGISAMELTLRTDAAMDALIAIRKSVPKMQVGIGTILTSDQAKQVADAGAAFGVAPGTNPRVVEAAQSAGLPFAPGVATPSDIESALALGCRCLKFFPAEPSGGLPYLRSIAAPYNHLGIKYVPLGGMNLHNMSTYLADPLVPAIGGSWLAPRNAINSNDWATIEKNAREAVAIVKQCRPL